MESSDDSSNGNDDNDDDESYHAKDEEKKKNDQDVSVEELEAPKRGRPKKQSNQARKSISKSPAGKKNRGSKKERTCPFCNKVFTVITGLAYHVEHKVCQRTNRRISIDKVGTVPYEILSAGQTFTTKFGVVRVVKDDRAGENFGKTKIAKNYKDLKKKYQRKRERNANRKSKVYMFVAKKGRQKRDILLQHYLKYKEQNFSQVGTSGTPSQDYVEGIWNENYPHSTPNEILSGVFKKSLAIPLIPVDHPDEIGEDPAAPADSYPERMVECVLVKDGRRRIRNLALEGEGRLSQVDVAKDVVQKMQKKLKGDAKRRKSNGNGDEASEQVHESGMKLFVKRKELIDLYNTGLPIYSCERCGKKLNSRAGCKSHIDQKSCINEGESILKSRAAWLQEVEASIDDELKPPPWILPPLTAPPGEKKRKRCTVLPGWIVFHHEKSSIYPQVFTHLKLKRGSNNTKFMQKRWDVIGPGRKKVRKSRARRHSVMSVVHQVNDWMDLSDHAVYPGVMAALFPITDKRRSSRRAASRKAKEKVSQCLDGDEEEGAYVKEEEYNPDEESDVQDGDDFFPSENFDFDAPMPPLSSHINLAMKETMPPLPTVERQASPIFQPITVDQPQAVATSLNLNLASKRNEKSSMREDTQGTEESPKKRRRRKPDTVAVTKPLAPVIVDIRPLVEEVRGGRYPSMKVYNGQHLNICMLCKTQDNKVLNCEFCANSEHLGCVKSKVTIRDPEASDEFMCHRCIQTVLARRSRAEKRRLEKLTATMKGNSSMSPGVSLEQAKDAAVLKREVIWSLSEFDDHVASYSKCLTGGPGGLICCGPCTASYSRLLSETAKEMETQTLSGVGREVSELLELLHDAQVRLLQAVDISNTNGIRRDMLRDGDEEEVQSTRERNSGLLGIMDIFNSK